jgi:hypothetical protein
MKDLTNKELLEIILSQTKDNAKKQFEFSCEMSVFANEQRDFNSAQIRLNDKFEGYFESNPKTKQKGFIEQTQINTSDISEIKSGLKINHAKKTFIGIIVGAVLAFLAKAFF